VAPVLAVQVRLTCAFPEVAVSPVGAAGAAAEVVAAALALDTPTQPVRWVDNKPISGNIKVFLTRKQTLIVQPPPELVRSRAGQLEYVMSQWGGA
jgi:hypothetical protein